MESILTFLTVTQICLNSSTISRSEVLLRLSRQRGLMATNIVAKRLLVLLI